MNEIALRLAMLLFDQQLIQNQYRSAFVEAMLLPYLAPGGWRYTGNDWSGIDFKHDRSGALLELKQGAAWQTWSSRRGKGPSPGNFDIAPRKRLYDEWG